MRKKIFLMLALLCAIAQGARAEWDVWDGQTKTEPVRTKTTVYIYKASDLAYVLDHWDDDWGYYYYENFYQEYNKYKQYIHKDYCEVNYELMNSIDMGDYEWIPLGRKSATVTEFKGKFNGNRYTIRINISEATKNNQGLFAEIASGAEVTELHVAGRIQCKDSRLVGGICGENNGTIRDCWVSANVGSDWKDSGYAKVGGIAGQNDGVIEYCCMSGDVTNYDDNVGGIVGDNSGDVIRHCTFYGNLHIDSSKENDNVFAGDHGTEENCYTDYNEVEYQLASSRDLYYWTYFEALRNPYEVNLNINGKGGYYVNKDNTAPGQTITVTRTYGPLQPTVTVKDANGNDVALAGSSDVDHSYWFTMPRCGVTIHVECTPPAWSKKGAGTEDDPYLIENAGDWDDFVDYVNNGNDFSGKYLKLTSDISVTTMAGTDEQDSFLGTFDGGGHTLTVDYNTTAEGTAPFRFAKNTVIKNLHVCGTIQTSAKYAAGLVAQLYGSITIENCRS